MPLASRRLAALAAVLLAGSAAATVVVAQTIEQLAQSATLVIRGRVGQVQSRFTEGERGVVTEAEVRVEEALKGAAPTTVVVRQPGGVVGRIGQHVAGTARFHEGEEVVLFLDPVRGERQTFHPLAMALGKVSLQASPAGDRRAVRHLRGLAQYGGAAQAPIRALNDEDLGAADAFLARVRKATR